MKYEYDDTWMEMTNHLAHTHTHTVDQGQGSLGNKKLENTTFFNSLPFQNTPFVGTTRNELSGSGVSLEAGQSGEWDGTAPRPLDLMHRPDGGMWMRIGRRRNSYSPPPVWSRYRRSRMKKEGPTFISASCQVTLMNRIHTQWGYLESMTIEPSRTETHLPRPYPFQHRPCHPIRKSSPASPQTRVYLHMLVQTKSRFHRRSSVSVGDNTFHTDNHNHSRPPILGREGRGMRARAKRSIF
jgi:hypothetical protein